MLETVLSTENYTKFRQQKLLKPILDQRPKQRMQPAFLLMKMQKTIQPESVSSFG